MLKPEKARAELENVRFANGDKRRLAALAGLPRKLTDIGRGIMGRSSQGKTVGNLQAREQAEEVAAGKLDHLPAKDRRRLFDVLFPNLGGIVDKAWDLLNYQPYEVDFEHKAFRAPNNPELTRMARFGWLRQLLNELEGYEQDISWLASWAGYLTHGYSGEAVGVLLAAAINLGGREGNAVLEILRDSARGVHPIGIMGRHVLRAFLIGARSEGWDTVENLLLTAGEEESDAIMQTISEAHPEAFRRMLRLILTQNLARFPATVRAMNAWFGFQWENISLRVANRVLERVLLFLEDASAQARALESDDAETLYLALWTIAFEDAQSAVAPASALLQDPNVNRRFLAVHLLAQLQLPAAETQLFHALEDSDLRVALCALEEIESDKENSDGNRQTSGHDLFEPLQRLLSRMPQQKTHLEPIVWPWHVFAADREAITASLLNHLGNRPASVLISRLPDMESSTRREWIHRLVKLKKWDAATRSALICLAGDPSITVRDAALTTLAKAKITPAEAKDLEMLLERKSPELRRGVIAILLKQSNPAALESVKRLLAAGPLLLRQGGQELAKHLIAAGRLKTQCEKLLAGKTRARVQK